MLTIELSETLLYATTKDHTTEIDLALVPAESVSEVVFALCRKGYQETQKDAGASEKTAEGRHIARDARNEKIQNGTYGFIGTVRGSARSVEEAALWHLAKKYWTKPADKKAGTFDDLYQGTRKTPWHVFDFDAARDLAWSNDYDGIEKVLKEQKNLSGIDLQNALEKVHYGEKYADRIREDFEAEIKVEEKRRIKPEKAPIVEINLEDMLNDF